MKEVLMILHFCVILYVILYFWAIWIIDKAGKEKICLRCGADLIGENLNDCESCKNEPETLL